MRKSSFSTSGYRRGSSAKADTIGQDVEEETTVLVETGEAFDVPGAHRGKGSSAGLGPDPEARSGTVAARASTGEVRGSNPLSSTRKSVLPDMISYAAERFAAVSRLKRPIATPGPIRLFCCLMERPRPIRRDLLPPTALAADVDNHLPRFIHEVYNGRSPSI
jgi:hypothetical protein